MFILLKADYTPFLYITSNRFLFTFSTGFVLYFEDEPILGYCVDSGFKKDVYEFFFQASTVIVDARENGSKEHASVSTKYHSWSFSGGH